MIEDTFFEIPPIRCYTCNTVLADKYVPYNEMLKRGLTREEALNQLGLVRPCCRMRLLNAIRLPYGSVQPMPEETIKKTRKKDEKVKEEKPVVLTIPIKPADDDKGKGKAIAKPVLNVPIRLTGNGRVYSTSAPFIKK